MVGRSAVLQHDNSRAAVALWPPAAVPSSSINVTDLHDDGGLEDSDRHALLYIVVVLLFYSTGIVIAIVTYLKREKAEIEEEKAYEDYARSAAVSASQLFIHLHYVLFTRQYTGMRCHRCVLEKLPVLESSSLEAMSLTLRRLKDSIASSWH